MDATFLCAFLLSVIFFSAKSHSYKVFSNITNNPTHNLTNNPTHNLTNNHTNNLFNNLPNHLFELNYTGFKTHNSVFFEREPFSYTTSHKTTASPVIWKTGGVESLRPPTRSIFHSKAYGLRSSHRKTHVRKHSTKRTARKIASINPKRSSMSAKSLRKKLLRRMVVSRRALKGRNRKRKRDIPRLPMNVSIPENYTGLLFKVPKLHPDERFEVIGGEEERERTEKEEARKSGGLPDATEASSLGGVEWMEDADVEVNAATGVVSVREGRRLDHEKRPLINIILAVSRASDPFFRSNQSLVITVEDVNDEVPVFINTPHPFLASVPESAMPGTTVYNLVARDVDENSDVRYFVQTDGADGEGGDVSNELFRVDALSGVVSTKKPGLIANKDYYLDVYARDMGAHEDQRSRIERLSILVGVRKPQFHSPHYRFNVSEALPEGHLIGQVTAVSHTGSKLTYEVTTSVEDSLPSEFSIDPHNGTLFLIARLDYEQAPQHYVLVVKAIAQHSYPLTTSVEVEIRVTDENDNPPSFHLSQFVLQNVPEDVPIGSQILKISATDEDSGLNGLLDFSLSDHHFSVHAVENTAHITVAKSLDYDLQPSHTYSFSISASDRGSPSLQGSANVMLVVTNINDHPPTFSNPVEHIQVSEDAFPGTVIHVVQAYDVDGDSLSYSFLEGTLISGPFEIAPDSGILTLRRALDKQVSKYFLNISATDDGSCCGAAKSLSSRGVVVVEVKDINNNAPKFSLCSSYKPTVMEKENIGTAVIQVRATDHDTGDNSRLTYSLVRLAEQSSFDKFEIHPKSGLIVTTDILDRESKHGLTDFGVTVKAEDHGSPSLAGFCSFRIKVGDKNDNAPIFSMSEYTISVEESIPLHTKLKQIYATDKDSGKNSEIVYFIKNSSETSHLFHLHPNSGWISVASSLLGYKKITFEIVARDEGEEPLSSEALVTVEIVQKVVDLPRWQEESMEVIQVPEDVPVNHVVARFKALSANMSINYVISPGDSPEHNGVPITFFHRHDHATNEMVLMTYRTLDFETIPKYILNIKAANRAMYSMHVERQVVIQVLDSNDEIPQFIGLDDNGRYSTSVAENLKPGVEVIRVVASDKDTKKEYRQISYEIKVAKEDHNKFQINASTGVITTLVSFDRETKSQYYITLVAKDGAPSSRNNHFPPGTPNQGEAELQVRITDTNDNPPFFVQDQYKIQIPENLKPGSIIRTITAHDLDQENFLSYSITLGNVGKMFEVVSETGQIKVRGHLDYEQGPKVYRLTYRVFDEKFARTTLVLVSVADVNDNPPTFQHLIYTVNNVTEEDQSISMQRPLRLLTVKATDVDGSEAGAAVAIKYSLMGQFVTDKTFLIDENTGSIYLTRPLDRDPPNGRPVYHFNVLAFDGKLTGYAEVKVALKDINDNVPVFRRSKLHGSVMENSPAGQSVLNVVATDSDYGSNSSIHYSLHNIPTTSSGAPIFAINKNTGLIKSLVSDLDREAKEEYRMKVVATDRGNNPRLSASARISIKVDDANDHSPKFRKALYYSQVQENLPIGAPVVSITATDDDVGLNARLAYSFKYPEDAYYFSVASVDDTPYGVLRVKRNIDYESLEKKQFNLTVKVTDPDPTHVDTCQVLIKVTDINDNPPSIIPSHHHVSILESTQAGTSLFKFNAHDNDSGVNAKFRFQLDDPLEEASAFAISSDGLVTTKKALDRECVSEHDLVVMAVDAGSPPLTGLATFKVSLEDVNDNPPRLNPAHQRVVVMESQPIETFVAEVTATDADREVQGPPFHLATPCYGSCPCWENPACEAFSFSFNPEGGPNQEGSGTIRTKQVLDREAKRTYHLPIIMSDSGVPSVTGTSTLTIIVGDLNDHIHKAATKHIRLLTHSNQKNGVYMGRVYVEDADDWDLPDKVFTFARNSRSEDFRMDKSSGRLYTNTVSKPLLSQDLWVDVYDQVHDVVETSLVRVQAVYVARRHIANHASVRLQGTTTETFMRQSSLQGSLLEMFTDLLSKIFRVENKQVLVLNVLDCLDTRDLIDVFYTVLKRPSPSPDKLNGLLALHSSLIYKKLKLHVVMSPVNLCLAPLYHSSQQSELQKCKSSVLKSAKSNCFTGYFLSNVGNTIDSNATSYTAIGLYQKTQDECFYDRLVTKRLVSFCSGKTCLHGGKCVHEDGRLSCLCSAGHTGPFCEVTAKQFKGSGFLWLAPISTCHNLHISLAILPRHLSYLEKQHKASSKVDSKGYNRDQTGDECIEEDCGSVIFSQEELSEDLQKAGVVSLLMKLESDEVVVQVEKGGSEGVMELRVGSTSLYDGSWHHVDLFITPHHLRLMLDRCTKIQLHRTSKVRERCSSTIFFYDENDEELMRSATAYTRVASSLNHHQKHHTSPTIHKHHHHKRPFQHKPVFRKREKIVLSSGPLQLGGLYMSRKGLKSFDGCIKNFKVNGIIHDLHTDPSTMHANVFNGCSHDHCHAKSQNTLYKNFPSKLSSRNKPHNVSNYDDVQNSSPSDASDEQSSNANDDYTPAKERQSSKDACTGNSHCTSFGFNGLGRCVCKPGWQGNDCLTATPSADFYEKSYISWHLQEHYHNLFGTYFKFSSQIELMFRTRSTTGQLIKVQNNNKSRFVLVRISNGHLLVTYNFHGTSHSRHHLSLSRVRVDDGLWHSVVLRREEDFVEVQMDWGDSIYSNSSLYRHFYSLDKHSFKRKHPNNDSWTTANDRAGFVVARKGGVFLGADLRLLGPDHTAYLQDDFNNGCMKDIRLNGYSLPLFHWQSSEVASIGGGSLSVLEGCHDVKGCSEGNNTALCAPPFVCMERWRKAECSCPKDERPYGDRQCAKKQSSLCSQLPDCGLKCTQHAIYRNGAFDLSDNQDHQEECLCENGMDLENDSCFAAAEPFSSSTTTRLLLFVFLSIIFFIIVAFLLIMIFQRRLRKEKMEGVEEVDKYGSLKEKVVHYNEGGIGEQDQKAYDLLKLKTPLQKPLERVIPPPAIPFDQNLTLKSKIFSLTDLLAQKLQMADNDPAAPPFESVRQYRYEGRDSLYGSFSSLESCQPSQRYNLDTSPYPLSPPTHIQMQHLLKEENENLS